MYAFIRWGHTTHVGDKQFLESNIIKLPDVSLENCLLKNEYFNKVLHPTF